MNKERIQKIKAALMQALSPQYLDIVDESAQHIGHEGAKTGRGHFAVHIHSLLFEGKSLAEQHRLVYEALASLMETDIHALRIYSKAPLNERLLADII